MNCVQRVLLQLRHQLGQWRRARRSWREAWIGYGGWPALICSPYFLVAVALAGGSVFLGLKDRWVDLCLTIVPSILGFSIGGFAIFLAFGDDRFRALIAGPDDDGKASPFLSATYQFTHFASCQVGAVLLALVARAVDDKLPPLGSTTLAFLGTLSVYYALLLGLALIASLLKLSRAFDRFMGEARERNPNRPDGPL